MNRTKLYIAMLVLFAPAVALASNAGGNGNGNGGVGGGMGNSGIGAGSSNGVGNDVGNSSSSSAGMNSSDRAVDASLDSDSAIGRLAQARQDAKVRQDRAATRQLAASGKSATKTVGKSVNSDAHGDAVSTEAKLAKSENDGDTVGADVRAVAHDKTTLKTHTGTHTRTSVKTHTKGTRSANHGADVSAKAKLAKSENDGDTVGADVSTVAKSKSKGHGKATAKGHGKTHI